MLVPKNQTMRRMQRIRQMMLVTSLEVRTARRRVLHPRRKMITTKVVEVQLLIKEMLILAMSLRNQASPSQRE
jgi:hypothetical protein